MSHIQNQIKNPALASDNTLHVIGVISNPARWHSRIRLFNKWRDEMLKTPGVKLYVVEGVYGDHQGECAPLPGQEYGYLKVKLSSEIWLKENMINIAQKNLLPRNWKYLSWCDCDVSFENKDWVQGALNALQSYHIIQPWSHGISLDHAGGVASNDASFGYLAATGQKMSWGHHQKNDGYSYAHTGYAWACTRYFFENIGKLIDFCLIGSADHHIAWCCVSKSQDTVHGSMTQGYKDALAAWSRKAAYACAGRVGFSSGILKHGFHGTRDARDYVGRWNILVHNKYDPERDIAYDGQGVLYLIGNNAHAIETGIMRYNRSRREDSI